MLGNRTGSFVVGKVVHLPPSTTLDVLFKHYAFENILPFCKTVEEATTTILSLYKEKGANKNSLFYVWGLVVMEHRMGKGTQQLRCSSCRQFVDTTPAFENKQLRCPCGGEGGGGEKEGGGGEGGGRGEKEDKDTQKHKLEERAPHAEDMARTKSTQSKERGNQPRSDLSICLCLSVP